MNTKGLIIDLVPIGLIAAALVVGAALAPDVVEETRRGMGAEPPPYDLAELAEELELRRHREGLTVVHRHVDLSAVQDSEPITLTPVTITGKAPKPEAKVWTCGLPRPLVMGSGMVRECRTVLP